MSSKISVVDRVEKERGKQKQQTWQKPEPQQMQQQQQQREQASHHRHHERNIVIAFVAVGVVVVLGFFMAKYVINLVSSGDTAGKVEEMRSYNGFEFVKIGNDWFTEWQRGDTDFSLRFRYPPWEVEGIKVVGKIDERFSRWPTVFVTYDPSNETTLSTKYLALAAADTATFLSSPLFERNVLGACTANITDACANRPIVTCSTNSSIIYLKVSNDTGVFLEGNCATFQGSEENITKVVHKAIYQWLGIIKK